MEFGPLIKYFRTQLGMTQKELAAGICSVPHLSKIEGNSKEANEETVKMLLERLGIDQEEIQGQEGQIKGLLAELNELIDYQLKDDAEILMSKLKEKEHVIPFSSSLYLYEMAKYRYLIFIGKIPEAEKQQEMLNKHKKNFSQYENCLFRYLNAVLLLKKGNYQKADEILISLLPEWMDGIDRGELLYDISLSKAFLEQTGHSIHFGNQALQSFKNTHNFIRILHTLMLLAISYTQSKIYEEALSCLQHLIRNLSLLEDLVFKAQVFHNMGYLQSKMGETEKALYYYKKSLSLQKPDTFNYLVTLFSIGETQYELGEQEEARTIFSQVNDLAKELDNKRYLILVNYYLLSINSPDKSVEYLETKVLPAVNGCNALTVDLNKFYKLLSSHYKSIGKADKAVLYLEKII
ncbi:tetratricopeptide repeat protein [Mesobacillus zeae]|nr:tetratricopeptide repeat protein [Mesobacillus zeae]